VGYAKWMETDGDETFGSYAVAALNDLRAAAASLK